MSNSLATSHCLSPPLAKLERRGRFSSEARKAFLAMPYQRQAIETRTDIVREGERTRGCSFIESGTVSRSKLLPSGGRQIVSFHIAGDLVDLQSALLIVADHTLRTHEPSFVVKVSERAILKVAEDFPEIGRSFWFDTMVDASIFREWSLNLGRRSARERTGHLLLELGYKSEAAGLSPRSEYRLPMTQLDLADALGLTVVHVCRSLKWLREMGLLHLDRTRVVIPDWDALAHFAQFQPLYLHPEGPRALAS
ncbi:Crp/Fnr family transcriptional regulator [Novosphingobium sp. JCM 18896]|uniref:Crp/Fnr family transcriptional regulator n=1 Tax=Novosphingobium sp. JCM 18896 TaxID=2989731 RepID=UPI00222149C3|nr:Crp/Fnr family transcriptional regulator [Novosphingobium sp. JCM 18896]MCW1432225.1 Crp/Fnr family transcriptional regulator [Novosphingobium sp. JCM 18896]